MLGARLQLALLSRTSLPTARQRRPTPYSWRFAPDTYPCVSLVSLADRAVSTTDEFFGIFDSSRKARNALGRTAATHELCHSLLGIAEGPAPACRACAVEAGGPDCGHVPARLGHLTRAYSALRELRLPAWPYPGPIGIRERSDLHIIDRWRYLGTARNEAEIHAALETRAVDFDVKIFRLLAKTLGRLPRNRIACLAAIPNAAHADEELVYPPRSRPETWPPPRGRME
jgi:DNA polymerase-3 subunit epsilon